MSLQMPDVRPESSRRANDTNSQQDVKGDPGQMPDCAGQQELEIEACGYRVTASPKRMCRFSATPVGRRKRHRVNRYRRFPATNAHELFRMSMGPMIGIAAKVSNAGVATLMAFDRRSLRFCGNWFHYIQNGRVITPSAAHPTCGSQR